MARSQIAGLGFGLRSVGVASSKLSNAVAASLAVASLSLCLIVAVTLLTIKVAAAMPVAG
jgi:hypothetical protein